MDVLKVDTQMLRHQVDKLQETIGQLEAHEKAVNSITDGFGNALKGETGDAVQTTLASYHEAMAALRTEQQSITDTLQSAVAAYDSTDSNAAAGLTNAMHL
ncbi:MAG: WXG100 family type VII secretion target [Mycobacterium sp.]|nr:WXG100 family type VII secretion target [Mycobacterium sp.]